MIVDPNLLQYAVDENSPHNAAAASWLAQVLEGDSRIGLPWRTIRCVPSDRYSSGSRRESIVGRRGWEIRSGVAGSPAGVDPTRDRDHGAGLREAVRTGRGHGQARARCATGRSRNRTRSRTSFCRYGFHAISRASLDQPTGRIAIRRPQVDHTTLVVGVMLTTEMVFSPLLST